MNNFKVKINSIELITHDVLQITTQKPLGLNFIPGQATEISINKEGWQSVSSPFSFTSLPQDDYLQFTIKTYPERKRLTNELLTLKKNDELILQDVFGTIAYKNEGYIIAGGTGVTPFICILRDLQSKNILGNNKLIFANKTRNDIILKDEFFKMLGKNFINILSEEQTNEYESGFISEEFLKRNINDFSKNIYLCGPPKMMIAVQTILFRLVKDKNLIIKETA